MVELEARLRRFLEQAIAARAFPGAVAWVERDGRSVAAVASGRSSWSQQSTAVHLATPYDLGSLTKPLCTALLVHRRIAAGRIDIDSRLGQLWPRFGSTPLAAATVGELLSHRAGLPAWWPIYLEARRRNGFDAAFVRLAAAAEPSPAAPRYSDIGYLILGRWLERSERCRLDRLFRREIARPLGLVSTDFPRRRWPGRQAPPTEISNATERRMAAERGLSWRRPSRAAAAGRINDLNARTLGAAGHAGLFGTAAEVAALTRLYLGDAPEVLPRAAARRAIRELDASGRTAGWQTARECAAAVGRSRASFGHTGFPGTSVWCEPAQRRIAVLLTNRVHPEAVGEFQARRNEFHRLAFAEE